MLLTRGLLLFLLLTSSLCAQDSNQDPPATVDTASEVEAMEIEIHEEDTLDRAGQVNPGNTQHVPRDLNASYHSLLHDSLWIKAGGFLQVDALGDFGTRGNPTSMAPSQLGDDVVTAGFKALGDDARLNFRRTRLYADVYTPYPRIVNGVRAYVEADFSGANGNLNLRHAFVAIPYLLLGRTNSAFKDPTAEPETVDNQGPNSSFGHRQQGIRVVVPLGEDRLAVAAEDPGAAVSPTGLDLKDDGLDRKIDYAAHYRHNEDWGHLQVSLLRRDLSLINPAYSGVTSIKGWGLGLSGQIFREGKDNFQFEASAGPGIGRYLNDLSGTRSELGLTLSGEVQAQWAWGGFLAYQHWFDDETRLNTFISATQVSLLDGQPDSALRAGYKGSVNVMRDLSEHLRVGLEYLHALSVSKDGTHLQGGRLQFMVRYGF
ncbi:hypothetical protein IV102_34120 [bacterium]|nr:hypothetical protein [bacterium]